MGIDPARLDGPIIGIASTWTGTMPCNLSQRELADPCRPRRDRAGGTPMGFNTIAVSDNRRRRRPACAPRWSREIIADSIELMGQAHGFDALVCIVGCDKTVPAALMALARLDKPAVVLYGGRCPGRWRDRDITIQDIWEALGRARAAGSTRPTWTTWRTRARAPAPAPPSTPPTPWPASPTASASPRIGDG